MQKLLLLAALVGGFCPAPNATRPAPAPMWPWSAMEKALGMRLEVGDPVRRHVRVLELDGGSADDDYMPTNVLSAAVRAFPRQRLFRVTWAIEVGSFSGTATALYDRTASTLRYYGTASADEGGYKDHHVYTSVTASVLQALARRHLKGGDGALDAGFRDVPRYGCGDIILASHHP